MSDTPPPQTELTENDQPSGGWKQPATPTAWRAPEKTVDQQGWRVPTLPANLKEEPAQTGAWHLPSPEDTIFTPQDVIEIAPPQNPPSAAPPSVPTSASTVMGDAIAPEDALFGAAKAASSASVAQTDAPVAPEDLMYMLEHIDEKDDDFDTLHMSELVALANLADSQPMEVLLGAESPISAAQAAANFKAESGPQNAMLSPAERLALKPSPDDPGEYARQQLALLGGGTAATPVVADVTGAASASGTAEIDPGEYARQQLAQLGVGTIPVDSGISAPATPVLAIAPAEALNPREQELARRYHDTQDKVQSLRRMMQAGQISPDDFQAQLRDLMILDDDQQWWMMGVETDTWYKSDGSDWAQSTPPVLVKEERIKRVSARDLSGIVQQPLDYLPDSQPQQAASGYEEASSPASEIRLDENYMPLPNQVPVNDPDFTVPNPNVIDLNTMRVSEAPTVPGSSFTQDTVPGTAFSDQTVMATPVSYGRVEAPFDEGIDEPPDYDVEQDAPIYEGAAERQRQSTFRTLAFIAAGLTILAFLAAGAFIVFALLWYQGIVDTWKPQIAALANYEPPFQTIEILDSTGAEIATLGREGADRRDVTLERISPYFIHAVISLENERFYEDPGWDFFAILRAFGQNLASGEVVEGASTITQQVARNFVIQSAEVSAERKIDEIVVAGELTRQYSKNDILELYVNEVGFGNQTFGVEAAAQFYFGISAADLNLPQGAMLASLISAPSLNNPVVNREFSFDLMELTMERMAEIGCLTFQHDAPNLAAGQPLCITQETLDNAPVPTDTATVEVREYLPRDFSIDYPHFVQLVQSQLEEYFGADQLYRGGYSVTTTLDVVSQDAAQAQLEAAVQQLGGTGVNTGAVVVIDPRDGAVLAMVGSPDFNNADIGGQNNYSLTYRQPGSAIKPIVYATALQGVDFNGNGAIDVGEFMTPASILWDVQTTYDVNGQSYTPVNFDRQYHGAVPLRSALQNSYNVPAIKAYAFVGNEPFARMAEAMGIRFRQDAIFGLPTAVGATEVSLYDLTVAYATIANNGSRLRPFFIREIRDADGNLIPLPTRAEPVQAISPGTAYLLQNILSDDASRQPAFGANSALNIPEIAGRVGAKSGTSDGVRDLWTVGFTTNRVVGVWMGNNNNAPTQNQAASLAAAPVWNQVMRAAIQNQSVPNFVQPNTVIGPAQVCSLTGTLVDATCAPRRNEWWLSSQQPPATAQGFVTTLNIDGWSGLIANDICNQNIVTTTFVNINDPFAVTWLNTTAQGQQYARQVGLVTPVQSAPTVSCDANTPIPVANISSLSGDQTVTGTVQILGQATATDFQSYSVEFASAATPTQFLVINNANTQMSAPGSQLGAWDTTRIPNGDYVVQLTMISTGGRRITRQVQPGRVSNIPPTPTPAPATAIPLPTLPPVLVPTNPLPFDNATLPPLGPAPTVNPLGN